jgi:hypothetical protein
VIVITVELHDGEDVANIIEMLQTLQAELEV